MLSSSLIAVAFAGAATAFTPTGFTPSTQGNLTVVYGSVLAIDGKDIPKADTASAPIVGTTTRLTGTYALMMVDPDIPGSSAEFLHWMQAGLVSSNTTTTVAGTQIYELINPTNQSAIAAYVQPSPPNIAPNVHRYTQLLLQMNSNTSLTTLKAAGSSRGNFSAAMVVKNSGATLIAGNSFNVTNNTQSAALTQSNITKTTSGAGTAGAASTASAGAASGTGLTGAATGNGTSPKIAAARREGGGKAVIACLGAFVAAFMML